MIVENHEETNLPPVVDEDSKNIIDQYLTDKTTSGSTATTDVSAGDWTEIALPEGHKSGFIAIIGRPNVGKSTLVNAIIGQKIAIVSRKPQTTRTRITGILTQDDYQLVFTDTPGIHNKPGHKLNRLMIDQAISAIPDSDVILFVVNVSVKPREEDIYIAKLLAKKDQKRPVMLVLNKMDKLPLGRAKKRIESYWELFPGYADSVPTSALDGTNVELLRDHILKHMPEGPRYYPHTQITDQTQYQIAAELIREAMLRHTYQEIPHSAAVLVEDYEERPNNVTYIAARIWVERESQKPIVIGKNGQQLKKIGQTARGELERLIGGKIYLDLWVKVKPKWRDHDARLKELGF